MLNFWGKPPQWVVLFAFFVVGLTLIVVPHFNGWQWDYGIIPEIGVAFLVTAILGFTIDRWLKVELRTDAFKAAIGSVLPPAFSNEIEKILGYEFIGEKLIWKVHVKDVTNGVVLVTTSYERTVRNRTKTSKLLKAGYQLEDYGFANGPTAILECGVQYEKEKLTSSQNKRTARSCEVKTGEVKVPPDKTARVWGSATQYRRTNGEVWETFRDPVVNPEIHVDIDESIFSYSVDFGTQGDEKKTQYGNQHAFSGVYFPGRFMFVRWWPKSARVNEPPGKQNTRLHLRKRRQSSVR